MAHIRRITPCLWFDGQAEEAVGFYTGFFPDSMITQVSRYGEAGFEFHGRALWAFLADRRVLPQVHCTAGAAAAQCATEYRAAAAVERCRNSGHEKAALRRLLRGGVNYMLG